MLSPQNDEQQTLLAKQAPPSKLTIPTILLKTDRAERKPPHFPEVEVQPYDENEETTLVDEATLITESVCKQWFLAPLLSVCTLLVWPVFLYWSKDLQRKWLYSPATSLEQASHVYIRGRDGNREIVRLRNLSE